MAFSRKTILCASRNHRGSEKGELLRRHGRSRGTPASLRRKGRGAAARKRPIQRRQGRAGGRGRARGDGWYPAAPGPAAGGAGRRGLRGFRPRPGECRDSRSGKRLELPPFLSIDPGDRAPPPVTRLRPGRLPATTTHLRAPQRLPASLPPPLRQPPGNARRRPAPSAPPVHGPQERMERARSAASPRPPATARAAANLLRAARPAAPHRAVPRRSERLRQRS